MRNVAILALGLVFVAGCGTNLAGGVSLAQARSTCLAWDSSAEAGAFLDSLILVAEAARDSGSTEADFLAAFLTPCSDPLVTGPDFAGCTSCITQIAAAVWN